MSANKWWSNGDLPPLSMRYFHPSLQFLPRNDQLEEKDKILEERLTNLNMNDGENQMETLASLEKRSEMLRINGRSCFLVKHIRLGEYKSELDNIPEVDNNKLKLDWIGNSIFYIEFGGQDTPSVDDIEKRLAKLRGVPVENIRYPRSAILNGNEETVEKLMKRARDEAILETKWDRSRKSEEDDVDPEEFIKMCESDASLSELSGKLSISDTDVTMGRDTIRNLKDIQRTIKLAKQRSMKAAKLTGSVGNDNDSVDNEIKKLMKLTNQSNVKSEKISDELSKFWEKRFNHNLSSSESSIKSENPDDDAEIDYEELQKVVLEAEKAEMEATEMIKQSKKSDKKYGIFSKIFHSR
ncbi:unnamed protein product [Acanthocheilonema viteae]|uniref:Uncharacterized protein n=1 Tax=Acanthocheilonema viteae TaxID=6277 RepID=A0A498SBT8_ACAVI|nr:unnamed protein product [Acanthocheilonema viteae]